MYRNYITTTINDNNCLNCKYHEQSGDVTPCDKCNRYENWEECASNKLGKTHSTRNRSKLKEEGND